MMPTAPRPLSPVLALDIGGANVKLADGVGYAANWPFPLWKHPKDLAEKITRCLAKAPSAESLVVTMTGELCDCFETRAEGVRSIVAATMEAAGDRSVSFYQTNGQFVSSGEATEHPLLAAASNWHALAMVAARYCETEPGLLIDVGSTTTDIIPLIASKEAAQGRTDTERMLSGELVYSGVERSPVCAVVSHLPLRGKDCPVAQEFFATTADAYLLLGELPENPADVNTADGKPFTCAAAHTRLARMICADRGIVSMHETLDFAESIRNTQVDRIEKAFRLVVAAMPVEPQTIVLSGHGEFLARRLLERLDLPLRIFSLTEEWGPVVSRCAPAHALALLALDALK
ncbi:hydantoinase/oxoprolinase family protein [Bythopirellula polymerisocia]|uniref:Hydantoinase/oxoprolinase n=1 Tax=Bythopirellula polymerisocia TaxID=2528003 RepID=A0A5C6C7C2_9BACT|nr:hydantoinase/oxoprolinase family protein [Bythopirellula polymerisocia]TWU20058.1 Hydantoinase/oxoprolinase [Bythopirellula polymerisocia]